MSTPLPPTNLRVDVVGGDFFGRGDQPALSWWLPVGATAQVAYAIRTGDGYETGRVEGRQQGFVVVPVFDRSRRRTSARVKVWTDLGESDWSGAVELDSGLLEDADWQGSWIGPREGEVPPKGRRPAYWLRSTFHAQSGTPATLFATALGLYEVWLNGRRVGDAELTPGYTQYRDRVQYQSHVVDDLLVDGENVVAVLLADGWFRGQVGMPRAGDQFGTQTAVRLQLESGDGATLTTSGPGWLSGPSHLLVADLIGGQEEDHRRLDPSVHDPAHTPAGFAPAEARDPDVRVVRSIAPPVRPIEELVPASVTRLPDGASLVDLGQNITGRVRLADLGPAGTTVTLRHGEHLVGGDLTTAHLDVDVPIFPEKLPVGQVDVVTSAGVEGDVFEPRFTTHGFQYVRVEGLPHSLAETDLTGVAIHSDLRRTGWFECSDERLNWLHEATVWSLRDNIVDIPTDCPQRERSGWTGDWQIFAPTAAFLFDVGAFTRKWLRDVALDQRADGCVANISPASPIEGFDGPVGRVNGSAGWGDVVVSAPWDLHEAYGDAHLLREGWPALMKWLRYAAGQAASQRHPSRSGSDPQPHEAYLWDTGFHWGEWLEPGVDLHDFFAFASADKSEVATGYLHRSAVQAARMGEVVGASASETQWLDGLAAGTLAAWRAEFVDDTGRLSVQTQAAHVRALSFGLVPEQHRAAVADRLVELIREAGDHLATGFLSTAMLLPTLADHGHLDTAYDVLLQDTQPSWLVMRERGATTVWERWEGVDADGEAHESLNHYSKGAVISFLHRYVAGLVPTSPGYRTFRVEPRPGGGLTSARADLDSPFGPISSAWQITDGILRLDVRVPPGTKAIVVLPDGARHQASPGTHTWTSTT